MSGPTPLRFHLSLNAADLPRAVAFYRVLFGTEPAKFHDDYAKFDLDEPPVVFSLTPRRPGAGGSLSHLGLRVPDAAALDAVRRRLEAAGLPTQCQQGTVCGHARQNKVWVADPDGNFWEVYQVEAEVDPAEVRRSFDGAAAAPPPAADPVAWEHYLSEPPPQRIPHADGSLDEVRLTGTFNAALDEGQVRRLVREAFRVLRPGGTAFVHGLAGDVPFPGTPALPGIAALVRRVPTWPEVADALSRAGFGGLFYEKLGDIHCFGVNGVELREMRLLAVRRPDEDGKAEVLYKGPFDQVEDEEGNVFPRGRRVAVTARTRLLLQEGEAAGQFLHFPTAPAT